MAGEHSNLISSILVELSKRNDVRVWRNETGKARTLDGARIISYGLKGSADIMGLIGPDGRLLCVECKVGRDQQRIEQQRFQEMVERLGGLYILARSVEDVKW